MNLRNKLLVSALVAATSGAAMAEPKFYVGVAPQYISLSELKLEGWHPGVTNKQNVVIELKGKLQNGGGDLQLGGPGEGNQDVGSWPEDFLVDGRVPDSVTTDGEESEKTELSVTVPFHSMIKMDKNSVGVAPIIGVRFNDTFAVEAGYSMYSKFEHKAYAKHEAADDSAYLAAGSKVGKKKIGTIKLTNAHIDVLASFPVANDLDVFATVGVGRAKMKTEVKAEKVFVGKADGVDAEGSKKNLTDSRTVNIHDGGDPGDAPARDLEEARQAPGAGKPVQVPGASVDLAAKTESESKVGIRAGLGINYKVTDAINVNASYRYQKVGLKTAGKPQLGSCSIVSLGINYML